MPEQSDHDLLIEIRTTVGLMDQKIERYNTNIETRLEKQEKEDLRLHGRISEGNKNMDKKISDEIATVNNRIDKIRWWSIGTGGIGGLIGGLIGFFTGGKP